MKPQKTFKTSKYQTVEELGRGGMGVVYKAFAPQMGTYIALKVLMSETDDKQRFVREAKAMAKMNHPNIVKVYDFDIENDLPFFTMHYIEGMSLKAFLAKTSLNVRLFSKLIVKISRAMTYAHGQGIVHRDLKPANVMLDKNLEPYVMDFGIAKLTQVDSSLSKTGSVFGSPRYMSPQQAQGKKVDHLADVYALGAIFYEMLTGKPMVEGKNISEIMFKVIHREPKLLREMNSKLAVDLETICAKAVEKETAKRYKSAEEFANDIDRFLQGQLINARGYSTWQRSCKSLQKYKWPILAGFVAIAILFASIWVFEQVQLHKHISKAKKLQKKIAEKDSIEKKISILMQIKKHLERVPAAKKKLLTLQKKMGLLAIEKKNYLLAHVLFKQCRSIDKRASEKLLRKLKEDQNKQKAKDKNLVNKAMQMTLKNTFNKTLMDSYVFRIVKIQKPYVVNLLVPYLESENRWQRFLAIQSLGKLGNSFTKFKDKDSVQWLLGSLEKFNDKKAIEENEEEVENIIWALGWLKDARANYPIYQLRFLAGVNSPLWDKTIIPYKWLPIEKRSLTKAKDFLFRGNMKKGKGDYVGAIVNYNKAIAIKPNFSGAYTNKGRAYQELKKHKKAISEFTKAIALNPKSASAYNGRGSSYLYLKKYVKAIENFSQAIASDPNFFLAYSNRGSVYRRFKKYSKAIANYNQAIAINPKYSGAYNGRGNVYADQGENLKALEDFAKVIALNPTHPKVYNNRGSIYKDLGKYTEAINDFNQAIVITPSYHLAYNNRGSVYSLLGEYTKAIEDFNKAIFLKPSYSITYRNRGGVYNVKKEYAKAIEDFNKAIALNPKDFMSYNNKGYVYQILKKYIKAMEFYSKAIVIAPKNSLAYGYRGTIYQGLKEYTKALADFTKAISLNPKDFLVYNHRGNIYSVLRQYTKAIADYNQAIVLNPRSSTSYANRGNAHYRLKQYQKAYQDLQKFLKLAPNHPSARKIRPLIEGLKRKAMMK